MYNREIDGRELTLVPSGWTYERTFVLYDKETETLWYPYKNGLMGIQGRYFKRILPEFPHEVTRWKKWVKKHPDMPKWDCRKTIVIRNNRWRCDHGWDIDLDDGSSNYEIYNNLCLGGGIKLREGYCRSVYNNVLVGYTFCPHVWYPDCRTSFRHNIVWQDGYNRLGGNSDILGLRLDKDGRPLDKEPIRI